VGLDLCRECLNYWLKQILGNGRFMREAGAKLIAAENVNSIAKIPGSNPLIWSKSAHLTVSSFWHLEGATGNSF
jgi:hypothetical protein